MERAQFRGAFILVEGRDDRLFLERHVSTGTCRIKATIGKENVTAALHILPNTGFSGSVGCVDRDNNIVRTAQVATPNLVHTDGRDLECMLLDSPALPRVLAQLGSPEKLREIPDPIGLLRASTLPLGWLRYISEDRRLGLDFKDL